MNLKKLITFLLFFVIYSSSVHSASCSDGSEPTKTLSADGTYYEYKCANDNKAGKITLSFDWGDIRLCTSGIPNSVSNPIFTISSIPENAKWAKFSLTDLNVPGYPHGGGWVELQGSTSIDTDGNTIIDRGKFMYKSPCPPRGSHTYRWDVYFTEVVYSTTIIDGASASKKYP